MEEKKPDRIPPVKSVMTPFPWFIHIEDPLTRAKAMMQKQGIRHLPVTEDGEPVGVLTARDIHLLEGAIEDPKRRAALSVRDACVLDAFVVETSEPLDRVLLEMARHHIATVLVVKGKKLAGIFTVTDACRSYGEFLRAMFPGPPDDEAA
jgi:acetoin utilization protein AcuB